MVQRFENRDHLKNGDLLDAAEAEGFDVFVTTDRNIRYQQNLSAFIGMRNHPAVRVIHVTRLVRR